MIKHRLVAWGMTLVLSGGLVTMGVRSATASPEGRRNTAIGLGVATVGAALMKKKAAAVVLGVGTGVAAYKYHESVQDRKKKRAGSRTAQVASYRSRVSASRRPAATATRVVRTRPATSASRVAYAPKPVAVPAQQPVAEKAIAAQPVTAPAVAPSAASVPSAPSVPAGQPFGGPLALGLAALIGAFGVGLWSWMRREKALAR